MMTVPAGRKNLVVYYAKRLVLDEACFRFFQVQTQDTLFKYLGMTFFEAFDAKKISVRWGMASCRAWRPGQLWARSPFLCRVRHAGGLAFIPFCSCLVMQSHHAHGTRVRRHGIRKLCLCTCARGLLRNSPTGRCPDLWHHWPIDGCRCVSSPTASKVTRATVMIADLKHCKASHKKHNLLVRLATITLCPLSKCLRVSSV